MSAPRANKQGRPSGEMTLSHDRPVPVASRNKRNYEHFLKADEEKSTPLNAPALFLRVFWTICRCALAAVIVNGLVRKKKKRAEENRGNRRNALISQSQGLEESAQNAQVIITGHQGPS